MKTRKILIFLVVLGALVLQACAPNTQGAVETAIFQTQQISQLETAAAGGGQPVQPTADNGGGQPAAPSDTPRPSDTPTITLTNTPSVPYVSVSSDTNCRSGPGISYTFLNTMHTGQQAQVVNLFSYDYVVVINPNGGGLCWLWLNFANTHDFSAYNLPYATQPPTSTPTFTPTPEYIWDGSWTAYIDLGGGPVPCSMDLSRSGTSLSGTYDCGYPGSISGTLSSNLRNFNGTWTCCGGGTGTIAWQRKLNNTNQFIGNYDSSYAWCGAKSGASQPSPCYWP